MRFSESSHQALSAASREAHRLGQTAVGTGHLLLAMLQVEACAATALLRSLGADIPHLRRSLESQLPEAATEEPRGANPVSVGVALDETRLKESVRAGTVVRLPDDRARLPQTATLKRGIEQAIAVAGEIGPSREPLTDGGGAADVGTEHLLLGVLLQGGTASRLLGSTSVDAVAVRGQLGRAEPS